MHVKGSQQAPGWSTHRHVLTLPRMFLQRAVLLRHLHSHPSGASTVVKERKTWRWRPWMSLLFGLVRALSVPAAATVWWHKQCNALGALLCCWCLAHGRLAGLCTATDLRSQCLETSTQICGCSSVRVKESQHSCLLCLVTPLAGTASVQQPGGQSSASVLKQPQRAVVDLTNMALFLRRPGPHASSGAVLCCIERLKSSLGKPPM